MTTKFTPGAWADRGTGCVGTTHQLIASVYPMEDERPEEHVANVRLIAAAPELYQALQVALVVVAGCNGDGYFNDQECVIRAALAKAVGGAA